MATSPQVAPLLGSCPIPGCDGIIQPNSLARRGNPGYLTRRLRLDRLDDPPHEKPVPYWQLKGKIIPRKAWERDGDPDWLVPVGIVGCTVECTEGATELCADPVERFGVCLGDDDMDRLREEVRLALEINGPIETVQWSRPPRTLQERVDRLAAHLLFGTPL